MKFNTDTTFQVFPINNTQQGNRPIIFSLLRRVFYMHWCDIVLFFHSVVMRAVRRERLNPRKDCTRYNLLTAFFQEARRYVLVKCRMSSICITGVCCCERTKIAKVKTDEKEKELKLKRCAFSTGVVSSVPLYKKVYAEFGLAQRYRKAL